MLKYPILVRSAALVALIALGGCMPAPSSPTASAAETATGATADPNLLVAQRPSFPYRAWYAGNLHKNPEWYANATLDGSGRGDARVKEQHGVSHLNWVYGTQINWNAGPKYWVEHSALARRTAKPNAEYSYPLQVSGISVDEWTGSSAEKKQWVVEGLREAKKQNPDLFVAMWVAGVSKEVAELGREGTVDLIIVQAYNLTVQRGIGVSWDTGLHRMDVAKKEGLENKTIFSFGHVTSDANWKGAFVWTEEVLRQRMSELKARYPKMPGIAFFEAGAKDVEAHAKTVQLFDRLSAEYWPDTMPLDGAFSLTPQSATKARLRWTDAQANAKVAVGESQLDAAQVWNFKPLGKGIYQIQAPYDASLVVTAKDDGSVALERENGSAAQKWVLTKVTGGYTIAPLSTPNLRLQTDGTRVLVEAASDETKVVWAITPEYLASATP